MKTSRHLTVKQLLAAARAPERRLPPAGERHLAACPRCRGELETWRVLGRVLRDPAEEPSPGTVERAWALMAPRLPKPSERDRFVLARLVFDSRTPHAGRALRAHATECEQVWQARQADVSVQLTPPGAGTTGTLVGVVLPRQAPAVRTPGWVWLVQRGHPVESARVDPSGEFVLPAPRAGRWKLLVEWGGLRLRLEATR